MATPITCPKCLVTFKVSEAPCNMCKGAKFIKKIDKKGNEKEIICTRCNGTGSDTSARNRNNRSRGANNEYKVRDLFAAWWLAPDKTEYKWSRTPQSGGHAVLSDGFNMAGDICTTAPDWPFHVEAKRTKGWSFDQLMSKPPYVVGELGDHVEQAISEAPLGKIPLLFLQNPGASQPAYIMIIEPAGMDGKCTAILSHFPGALNGVLETKAQRAYRYFILLAKEFVNIPSLIWRDR